MVCEQHALGQAQYASHAAAFFTTRRPGQQNPCPALRHRRAHAADRSRSSRLACYGSLGRDSASTSAAAAAASSLALWLLSELPVLAETTDFSKGGFAKESYYVTLGLFLISLPGAAHSPARYTEFTNRRSGAEFFRRNSSSRDRCKWVVADVHLHVGPQASGRRSSVRQRQRGCARHSRWRAPRRRRRCPWMSVRGRSLNTSSGTTMRWWRAAIPSASPAPMLPAVGRPLRSSSTSSVVREAFAAGTTVTSLISA